MVERFRVTKEDIMRLHPLIVCAAAAAVMAGVPALAQDVERYQLERTQGGYVRLDTATGTMSICKQRGGQLVCELAVEEREAYDRDFDSLQLRVDELESRVSVLERTGGMPSDEEIDRTIGHMEKFFRSFMGIVKEFESDVGGGETQPEADRT
jgi:hypothetical protein